MKMTLALSISSLALAGCITKVPPPAIQYDKEACKPAAIEADPPKPVMVVKIPEPLPLREVSEATTSGLTRLLRNGL